RAFRFCINFCAAESAQIRRCFRRATGQRPKAPARMVNASPRDSRGPTRVILSYLLQLIILGLVVVGFYRAYNYSGLGHQLKDVVKSAIQYIEASEYAMSVYMVFTVFGVIALVPTTAMEFSGGFLFVPAYGLLGTLLLTCAAKFVANVIAVTLAKYVMRDWVRRNFVDRSELLQMVSEAAKDEPFKMAFLVRGSYAPLSVKNYGLGVLDIGYLPIMVTSCIFSPFYAIQNIYMGSACKSLQEVFAPTQSTDATPTWTGALKGALPVIFNLFLVLFMVRALKAQLKKSRNAMEAKLKSKCAGLCWVASRPLEAGHAVVEGEVPLASWDGCEPGLENSTAEAVGAFLRSSPSARQAWLSLSAGDPAADSEAPRKLHVMAAAAAHRAGTRGEAGARAAKAAAIAHLNAFCTLEDGLAIYERCSRFNHSCSPNAEYGLTQDGLMKVRVLRAIEPGEEVCVSYLGDALMSKSSRQQFLRARYFFLCTCPLCSLPHDELAGWTCACGRRRLSCEACTCGGTSGDWPSKEHLKAVDDLERRVAVLAATCGEKLQGLEEVKEVCRKLQLQFHVVSARTTFCLLERRLSAMASRPRNAEQLEEAWNEMASLWSWFEAEWNPLRPYAAAHLYEPTTKLIATGPKGSSQPKAPKLLDQSRRVSTARNLLCPPGVAVRTDSEQVLGVQSTGSTFFKMNLACKFRPQILTFRV
ncbi:SMYD5, partial [Symbiodinium sp. KB8]